LKNWTIATHPAEGIPIIPIRLNGGLQIGWLLGYAIDLAQGVLRNELTLTLDIASKDFAKKFEDQLYLLGGRFAAIVFCNEIERIYLDACGTLGAVYSSMDRIAASSIALFPERGQSVENTNLARALNIPNRDNWYPFELTPRVDLERLLPNHYLDLASWRAHRHWPRHQPVPESSEKEINELVMRIAGLTASIIENTVRTNPVSLSLTAGKDSRMMLACARKVRDKIQFYTDRLPDRSGRMDCHVAALIARKHRLKHTVIEFEEASQDELQKWLFRTGWCVAGRTWRLARTAAKSGSGTFVFSGLAGEVGRAFYWRETDKESTILTPEALIQRLRLPPNEHLYRKCGHWLENLPVNNTFCVLDLLYLEQRVGCWASPQFYGHVGPTSFILPYCHRQIIDGMLRLPFVDRLDGSLPDRVIADYWSELLANPFNEFTGIRKIADRAFYPVRRFGKAHPRIARMLGVRK
jgi:hypothetical protein